MIDVHFTITQAEYLEAQKLYVDSNRKMNWLRWALLAVVLLGLTVVALAGSGLTLRNELRQLLPAGVLVLVFFLFPYLQRIGFKKRFLKEKQNLSNAHLILDDAGYHVTVPGIGGGIAEWTGMDGWLEGKTVIVLRSGLLMRLVPKAPLTEMQLLEARRLLTEKLGPASVLRKG